MIVLGGSLMLSFVWLFILSERAGQSLPFISFFFLFLCKSWGFFSYLWIFILKVSFFPLHLKERLLSVISQVNNHYFPWSLTKDVYFPIHHLILSTFVICLYPELFEMMKFWLRADQYLIHTLFSFNVWYIVFCHGLNIIINFLLIANNASTMTFVCVWLGWIFKLNNLKDNSVVICNLILKLMNYENTILTLFILMNYLLNISWLLVDLYIIK